MEIAAEMRMILIDRGANRVQRVAQETGAGGESFACFTETCILVDAFAGNARCPAVCGSDEAARYPHGR